MTVPELERLQKLSKRVSSDFSVLEERRGSFRVVKGMSTELDIRIKKPGNLPMVGKFTDNVALDKAEMPCFMYNEQEEIEDDPEEMEKDEVIKDGAYWAERRKNRNKYRYKRKEILKLEDSTYRVEGGAPEGIMYEGEAWEPGLKDGDGHAPTTQVNYRERKHEVKDTEKPFNYALLQVIKSAGADGKVKTEVNIVPVKGFYLFRKPSVMPMKSLDLIDDDFELKMQADKARMQKYQSLFRSKSEALPGATDASAATAAANNSGGGNFVLPPVFGMAVKQRVKKGLKKNANAKSFLDETGADMDEINDAVDRYQGDFEGYRPNDDMGYADEGNDFAQNLEIKEAQEDTEKIETLHEDEDEEEDSEAEEEGGGGDDDEGDGGGDGTGKAASGEEVIKEVKGILSGVDKAKTSGLLDDRMLLEARQAGMRMAAKEKKNAAATAAASGGSFGGGDVDTPGDSSRKRGRSSPDAGAAGAGAGAGEEELEAKKRKVFELDEEGIREYLRSYGGPVPLEELKAQFKSKVKALNKQKKDSGIKLITELIKKLCKTEMDPVKGKMLSLK